MSYTTQMVGHAQAGQKVAYVGRDRIEVMREVEKLMPAGLTRLRRAHGQEAAEFASGGSIRFFAASKYACRGLVLDVLVIAPDVPREVREDARVAAKLTYYTA